MKHLIFLISFVAVASAQGQNNDSTTLDSTVVVTIDSTDIKLAQYERMIEENRARSMQDSIKKHQLLEQISLLKERDKYKQEGLLKQIKDIETKDSIRYAQRRNKILELKSNSIGYPVAPFSDTLFMIYLKVGPVKASERAASTSEKIQLLYELSDYVSDSMKIEESEASADITYGDMIVMSVTEWDALWWESDKGVLAQEYLVAIRNAVDQEIQNNSLKNLLTRSAFAFLIFVILLALIFALNRFFDRGKAWLTDRSEVLFRGIKIKNYELLPSEVQLELVSGLLGIVKWVIVIVLVYLSLPLVFSLFPFTKGWAEVLFGWVWAPAKDILLAIWTYLPNLFYIAVIYFITHYAVKLLRFFTQEVQRGRLTITGFHPDWASPTFNMLRFFFYAFMFVMMFPYLPGSDSPIFQGVSVFLGILFSLGSSTAIANAVSGLVITYMRPYAVGDRVRIGSITGNVIEKTLLVTRIKTVKNEYITVPNASILTGHTINYSTAADEDDGIVLNTKVTIGYDVPWRKVHELLIGAAKKTQGVNLSKDPFVLQVSLDDFYVSYELNAYSFQPLRMALIYSELHQNIQDAFNEAGIEILSPHYRANRNIDQG